MATSKKLVLFGTNRHAIAINDFYMFFRRSTHEIVQILYPIGSHKNRDWWEHGCRHDQARNSVVDPIEPDYCPITVWQDIEKHVFPILDNVDFDYICVGNGNDPAHQLLIERYGREKFLFSEYGWLPWSEHFYISRKGAGFDSDITDMTAETLKDVFEDQEQVDSFCASLNSGKNVDYTDFLYVPLQKDVNDFKFLFSKFKNNVEFIHFIDDVVPPGIPILLKCHPLYKKNYDLSFSNRLVDITESNLNKFQIYSKMKAMVCLNSTSILEALAFGAKVFTYGDDIFMNKGIVHHKIYEKERFLTLLENKNENENSRKFISLLQSYQIDRSRCVNDDEQYIKQHFWNICL